MPQLLETIKQNGLNDPLVLGSALLVLVILLFVAVTAFCAARYKGRSASAWAIISAFAQAVALGLPALVLSLSGMIDPREMALDDGAVAASTLRLFSEMSVVAGLSTLAVLGMQVQIKWKTCPACENRIRRRIRLCPHCGAQQPEKRKRRFKRMEPGDYPRLLTRTIHLPHALDGRLMAAARHLSSNKALTEDAAVSQLVRKLIEQYDPQLKQLAETIRTQQDQTPPSTDRKSEAGEESHLSD